MKLAIVTILALWIRAISLPLVLLFRRGHTYTNLNAIAEDQAWNAMLSGWPDETISARAYREKRPKLGRLINWIFSDPHHFHMAAAAEADGPQNAQEYRHGHHS